MMRKKANLFVMSVVFLTMLIGTSLISAAEVGVTDTTIKIGWVGDLTGPIATAGKPLNAGIKLYAKYINDKGGINGRKIIILTENDTYSPTQTVASAKKLIERDKVFCMVGNMGTHTTASIIPLIQKTKTPLLFPGTASATLHQPPKKYLFSIFSTYETEARVHADYIAATIDDPKVFVLYMDTGLGKSCRVALRDQLNNYGIDILEEVSHKPRTVDYSSHALKAYQAKANVVGIYSVSMPVGRFVKECQKLNYKPQFLLISPEYSDELLELAGDVLEGAVGTIVNPLVTARDKQVLEYREVAKKYYPGRTPQLAEMSGYFMLKTASVAIEKCGRDLTREKLIEVLETFKNYDSGGFGQLTYSPTRRIGADKVQIYVIKDKRYKYLVPGWHNYKNFD
ncbi:ABC transporter substrate-binding protein [Thermodesulfobacteriota bacterium]